MEELKQQTQTQTMVLEKVAPDISVEEEKKLEAEKKLFPTRFVEIDAKKQASPLPSQKINISAENEFELETQEETETLIQEEIEQEVEKQEIVEEEVKKETEQVLEEETTEEVEENKKLKKANSKRFKHKLKMAFAAMAMVLVCFGGWAIYNAVKIETLNAQMQAESAQYSVNVAKVITNVSKLDDLTNPNSITNLDELSSAQIIEVAPKAETFPKTLEKQSNWFDRVCNWLSNLFK